MLPIIMLALGTIAYTLVVTGVVTSLSPLGIALGVATVCLFLAVRAYNQSIKNTQGWR